VVTPRRGVAERTIVVVMSGRTTPIKLESIGLKNPGSRVVDNGAAV
jgi:hypothetical protein